MCESNTTLHLCRVFPQRRSSAHARPLFSFQFSALQACREVIGSEPHASERVARQRKAAVRRQHMCCSQHLPRNKVGSLRQCRYNWRSCDGGSAEAYRWVQASRFVRSGNVYGVINGVKRLLSLTCKFPEHQRALCSELTDTEGRQSAGEAHC